LDFFFLFPFSLLKDFRQKHPEVMVLDPPDAIQHLHNRQSMLQDVVDLNLSDCNGNLVAIVHTKINFAISS
jgi:ABC-type molybdenum transport system ATPase subunit/photorepair protein PhrA